MLKKIPKQLPPELVKRMMEMGHGDELVLADANFPGHALHSCVVRCDGIGVPELMQAVLELMPLDHYAPHQAARMAVVPGDSAPAIWEEYRRILAEYDAEASIGEEERFAFYERARSAYVVVLTGEQAPYGNLILKKGVVTQDV
ncbi:RbsD/FucU family protein [Gorillibacterium sp. sgz500922]|uniref:RbsD/FucU family protein n=1 Tax=Gorillibacterium sp. sgz500922 TaxID=3446694 RepID=UPI003F67C6D7